MIQLTKNGKRIRLGKRGEDMLVDFWAILIFAVICIIFLIIFGASKTSVQNTVVQQFNDKDVHFMLDSFLRAPVPGEDMTVSDVIMEDSLTGDYSASGSVFEEFFRKTDKLNNNDINDITLEITGYNSETIKITKDKGVGSFTKFILIGSGANVGTSYDADTDIPGYDRNIHIKLRLAQLLLTNTAAATGSTSTSKQPVSGQIGGVNVPILRGGH